MGLLQQISYTSKNITVRPLKDKTIRKKKRKKKKRVLRGKGNLKRKKKKKKKKKKKQKKKISSLNGTDLSKNMSQTRRF
jgi:hypothetical protein